MSAGLAFVAMPVSGSVSALSEQVEDLSQSSTELQQTLSQINLSKRTDDSATLDAGRERLPAE